MTGKIAVVTGGSDGIGLQLCRQLAQKGYTVYALSRRGAPGDGVQDEIRHMACDVTDEAALQRCAAQLGRADLLYCNAGMGISGPVEETDAALARRQLDVNFTGAFLTAKAFLPLLKNSGGRIVFVSSVAALLPVPFQAFYSASKAAINALVLCLANEVRPYGVSVCAVLPGDAKTGFTAARQKEENPESPYAARLKKSVDGMEKDEQNGMSAAAVAARALKVGTKRRVRPFYVVGPQYRLFCVLQKFLPQGLVNRLVYAFYG